MTWVLDFTPNTAFGSLKPLIRHETGIDMNRDSKCRILSLRFAKYRHLHQLLRRAAYDCGLTLCGVRILEHTTG